MYTKKNRTTFFKRAIILPHGLHFSLETKANLKIETSSGYTRFLCTIGNTCVKNTKNYTPVATLRIQQALSKIASVKLDLTGQAATQKNTKANIIQLLLLLTNLRKGTKFYTKLAKKGIKRSLIKYNKHNIQQTLKPSSTVTGFKKLMYNFVKLNQNQLQPSYNRRKYSHSHYNQTLKESTRLSHIYAYLSKPHIKAYCAFALKPANLANSNKNFITIYNSKTSGSNNKSADFQTTFFRPIPKLVNFLESRLDVILWRNQLANSIANARQTLRQGIQVNGSLQKKASFQTIPGDVFTL